MLKLGEVQVLKAAYKKDFGVYLADEEGETVLLPEREVPEGLAVGDEVSVFLYRDSNDRLIATSREPLVQVGELARLRVSDKTPFGLFVDIGLPKQVLVPRREMRYEPEEGEEIEVYLYVDKSSRLAASMYTQKHLGAKHVGAKERKAYFYVQDAEKLLRTLEEKFGGHWPCTDKTASPQRVVEDFGMSKAQFKRALGKLLKDGKVKMTKTSTFVYH